MFRLSLPRFPFPSSTNNEPAYGTTHRTRHDAEHAQEPSYNIINTIVLNTE